MSSSEKAKEIYESMRGFRVKKHHIKKCALVCVEQIRSLCPYGAYKKTLSLYDGAELSTDYWDEVKSEIEKL